MLPSSDEQPMPGRRATHLNVIELEEVGDDLLLPSCVSAFGQHVLEEWTEPAQRYIRRQQFQRLGSVDLSSRGTNVHQGGAMIW